MNRRILIIDDSRDIWQAYAAVLNNREESAATATGRLRELLTEEPGQDWGPQEPGFVLSFAEQGEKGFAMVRDSLGKGDPFSVAFIDIRMPPGWDGMETAARIRAIDPALEMVIVTAYSDRSRREIVEAVGSPEKLLFLRKPFDPDELYQLALSLCGKWNLARQQEQATQALVSSESRFRGLVETTSDWVWEMDAQGNFTYCSPVCEEIYGWRPEELLGKSSFAALFERAEGQRCRRFYERCVRAVRPFKADERQCRRKDGGVVHAESSGVPVIDSSGKVIGFRGVDRDISERRRHEEERRNLESQVRQSQKMEAIGTLAGGIAHDLNNMLTPILGYAEICLMEAAPGGSLHESLQIINQSAIKAADLIRKILAFSRKQVLSTRIVRLSERVGEFVKILRRLIPEDIALEVDLAKDCWQTRVDVSQVEQVLINLVVNARDAVSANGRIQVMVGNQALAGGEMKDIDQVPITGEFVVLTVRDNGSGMDQQTAARIFDPFYTTKDAGKGTGLGLSTVYGVVNLHKARLRLTTSPGQGAEFSIYFPRCGEESGEELGRDSGPMPRGDETILIAEDDAAVRQVVVSLLRRLGYSMIEAGSGPEALAEFERQAGAIALLLTDLVMPGMGGRELAERCRVKAADLPVIYMSGYHSDQSLKGIVTDHHTLFLPKPFKPADLAWKVREVLDKGQD